MLVMYALKDAAYWRSGERIFPAVNLNEKDIKIALSKLGFKIVYISSIPAEVIDEKAENYEGYKGFIFVCAKKT